jgi:putative transposase
VEVIAMNANTRKEAARLCRGGSSSLTFTAVVTDETPFRERPSTRGSFTMDDYESLSHTKWECKYHVVFIPKYRRKVLYGELRQHLGDMFRKLALQKESRIEEGHLMLDHVHMMISIPPKYAVSQVVGFIKGKSAIHLARTYGERKRNFVGQHFWARGYFVSTVGRDEAAIREYIKNQEQEDKRLDQLNLWR